jgi:hypothetical protein
LGEKGLFNNTVLSQEQKDLLSILVESSRNLPKDKREKFYIIPPGFSDTQITLTHPGLPNKWLEVYPGDIEVLASSGFLLVSYNESLKNFDVTPNGYAYYQYLTQQSHLPIERITSNIKTYIESDIFKKKYPIAYQKWYEAESILWATDSEQQLTMIGHLCRETIQEFANALVSHYNPPNVDENKSHDVNRIAAVLYYRKESIGETEKLFLDALLEYWKTISTLVQRQEHGSQRKETLLWEDGRRIIFQTVIVMYEVDRALST